MKPIASHTISNTLSLEIHKIDHTNDQILITENGKNPRWYDLYLLYNEETEEQEYGFIYGIPVLLSQFERIETADYGSDKN